VTPRRALAAAVAAAALAALTGCSGSTPSAPPASPSHTGTPTVTPSPSQAAYSGQHPAEPPPPGYTWAGSTAKEIWFAIPRPWVTLDLARLSLSQLARRFATTGIDNAAIRGDVAALRMQGGLFFADPASSTASPHRFTTNASVLCKPPGPASTSAAALASLEAQMRSAYASIKASILSLTPARVTGGKALEARLAVTATAGYRITELQVAALSGTGRACFITFTTDDSAKFLPVFRKAAASIHVG
jgi:hypothetical protein